MFWLTKEFEIKDLGQLQYFLGIEVVRSRQGIFISQRKYTLDLLTKTGMTACKLSETPIDLNHHFAFDVGSRLIDLGRYQCLVGYLIYLTLTRSDITYAMSVVNQFMLAPTTVHLDVVYHILWYLKSSLGVGLLYSRQPGLSIKSYTNADWIGSIRIGDLPRATVPLLEATLLSLRSKK